MYKKIMVPLDGSELAECVLPHVNGFVSGFQVDTIFFVRVTEPTPALFQKWVTLPTHTPWKAFRKKPLPSD